MNYSFDDFCKGNAGSDSLWLRSETPDIGGGRITIQEIDTLKEYPDLDTVTISGLRQDTFEYFIQTYGQQLRAIRFWKNKLVEDWSLLGSLPQLEYLDFFSNQRISSFWNMKNNISLTGLSVMDFSRIRDVELVSTAPALLDFRIGNAVWSTMTIQSFMPLCGTKLKYLGFYGRNIEDKDLSFLDSMSQLECYDFPTNLYTTEQVAWIAANHPSISGFAIRAYTGYPTDSEPNGKGWVVGKRKPYLEYAGNEERIRKYEESFERLKKRYAGMTYREAFGLS